MEIEKQRFNRFHPNFMRLFYNQYQLVRRCRTNWTAMHNITSQLFVSKYQLYLLDKEELRTLIEKQLNEDQDES